MKVAFDDLSRKAEQEEIQESRQYADVPLISLSGN